MKLAITLAVLAGLCGPAFAQAPAKERMVIVISLDGFPAYSLDDPKLPIPALRRLMQNGASARMATVNPTVTWPNHTTMVTGVRADEHGLLANGTILQTGAWPPVKVEPMIGEEKMVHVPTVYDSAYKAGLTTAQVDWVAINQAPTITWAFTEWTSAEGPVEREMIGKGVIAASDIEGFEKSNILFRDQIWTKAAVHLIREHKPNLLLFHLLSLDSVHHQFGPKTLAATAAIAFLDSCVEHMVEAVRAAGMGARTTFIVVSDHGFKRYTRQIRPAVALAAAGLSGKAYVLSEGGTAYVYFDKSQAAELTPKVIQALAGVEGIDKVIGPDGFRALGLPQPDREPQMYQLLLTAKDGYSFSGAAGGPVTAAVPQQGGSHGYLASDPEMDAIFIASGYGVRGGAKLDKVANIDIAPTIAKLLGVALPAAKGKAIPLE
ncbi:MAG: ectonucleotide pyrophosphatase/phosphodiesterase [Acidobacteriia bacterium]|nr:ectonucleotide pyrophosphatase/phosphodiesterase [Terriglobia bacterium]